MAEINPLRYRGYYYDTETELYYLQSRYYDPEIGRFINADSYTPTGQGILGCNMYAYCNNNPIIYSDEEGTSLTLAAAIGGAPAEILSSGTQNLYNGTPISNSTPTSTTMPSITSTSSNQGGISGGGGRYITRHRIT